MEKLKPQDDLPQVYQADEHLPEALPSPEVARKEAYLNAPERTVPDEQLPEALPNQDPSAKFGPLSAETTRQSKDEESIAKSAERRIWGLKRRTFWVLAIILAIVVIVAAIVGGVVGSKSSGSDNTDSPGNLTPSNGPATSQLSGIPGMHPASRLAAFNFTLDDVEHHRIYFQSESGVIMESSWDSNDTAWKVNPVTSPSEVVLSADLDRNADASELEVKIGTPIAVSGGHAENRFVRYSTLP
jgi:hypothetical protein